MTTRIASVDKLTFLTCVKYNLWGANNVFIDKWKIGDTLIFKVGNCLIASAKITGKSYMDDSVVWENGLFWNRVPIDFDCILDWNDCISFSDEVRNMFIDRWGKNFGWVILNKYPLTEEIEKGILNKLESRQNKITFFKDNIDSLLIDIK